MTKEKHSEPKKKVRQYSSFPFLLVMVGVILLLENLNLMHDAFAKLWPTLLIVIGAVKLVNYKVAE